MKTFIRVTEIWVPSRSRKRLELYAGTYGTSQEFEQQSAAVTFEHGEGLPGTAWERQCPVVLRRLDESNFVRAREAEAAGLTAAIALPLFSGEYLSAVVVFLCGTGDALAGAIELWRDDGLGQLALTDGYFGDLHEFERLSASLKFQRGRGLPGEVWETGLPKIMGDLGNSSSFLRARLAADAGIRSALGLPFFAGHALDTVVTFLSSESTPIARRFEIWRPDEARTRLKLESAIDGVGNVEEKGDALLTVARGEGAIGEVWRTGIPNASRETASLTHLASDGVTPESFDSLLAIPIVDRGLLRSVVVLYG